MKIRLTSCVPFHRKKATLSSTHQETLKSATSTSSNTLDIAVNMRNEILSLLANSMTSLSNASHEELYIYISPSMNSSETNLHVEGESNQKLSEKQGVLSEKHD
uniref:Putative cnidarian restricted protein n=1 Tax=Clytia hemisphaerica TaxID=252671 RepID=A0A069DMD4_9CNID